eukprot:TRINITY_DN32732_c0_g1_i1.p1 TRINITY_DN32732_c0_g1~~TRINITY_DN32732_c0_g1_i1.p1  ORF type:complete len:474 (-),score=61.55 TRINITY_DN32732_c0_g1_i1:122-1543(-)
MGLHDALSRRWWTVAEHDGVTDSAWQQLNSEAQLSFQQGYTAAMNDFVTFAGAGLATLCFAVVCLVPSLYGAIRARFHSRGLRWIEQGEPWVVWIQQFHHPILDVIHQTLSTSCGVEFYITFLPYLFWAGEARLARLLVIFMTACLYIGNATKDMFCLPRPDAKKVRAVEGTTGGDHINQEYGLPSTHTMNTICLVCYLVHHMNFYATQGPPGQSLFTNMFVALTSPATAPRMAFVLAGSTFWCFIIVWGRLYLGVHSPVDILGGTVAAILAVLMFIPFDDLVDTWITAGRHVPVYQLIFACILVFCYPTPLRHTPSYNYVIYFHGVTLGVVTGVWCDYERFHGPAAVAATLARRGSFFSVCAFRFVGPRFVVGIAVVLGMRAAVNEILKALVPHGVRLLGINAADHDALRLRLRQLQEHPEEDDPKCKTKASTEASLQNTWNYMTFVRLLSYAAVGWGVVSPAFWVFDWLGI